MKLLKLFINVKGLGSWVDLAYPPELHPAHNDYQLAPEKLAVRKEQMSSYRYQQKLIDELGVAFVSCEKLVPNLTNKTRYVVHHRNLQLYLSLGMQLTKVQKVHKFSQYPRMALYIMKNTELRKTATNDFEKDFYKLRSNAVCCCLGWFCPFFGLCEVSLLDWMVWLDWLEGFTSAFFRFSARRWRMWGRGLTSSFWGPTRRNESWSMLPNQPLAIK